MTIQGPQRGKQTEGFVLIAVLSVLALLSGIVVALLLLTRSAIDTAALASRDLEADAMIQSGISLAGYQLLVLKLPAMRTNGQQIRLDQGVVSLSVTSDAGRIDINAASKDLLDTAYRVSGLKAMTPEIFAARVMDWRDVDDEVGEDGAEAAGYAAAGLDYAPRNGPFRSVEDLRWVMGVSAADLGVLRDLLTIYNPRGRLDVFSAPGPIIAALPGVDEDIAKEVLNVRSIRNDATIAKLADLLLVQSALIDGEPPVTYRVRIDAHPNGGGKPRRVEVVMSAGVTPGDAYQILHWAE